MGELTNTNSHQSSPSALELNHRFIAALQNEDAEIALRAYKCTVDGLKDWEKEEETEKHRIEQELLKKTQLKKNQSLLKKLQLVKDDHELDTVQHKNKRDDDSVYPPLFPCLYDFCMPFLGKGRSSQVIETYSTASSISSDVDGGSFITDKADLIDIEVEYSTKKEVEHFDGHLIPSLSPGVLEEIMHPSSFLVLLGNSSNSEDNHLKDHDNDDGVISDLDRYPDEDQALKKPNNSRRSPSQSTFTTTPLHEAARLGNSEFVRALLSNGGDPSQEDGLQRTSLHLVCGGLTNVEESVNVSKSGSFDVEEEKGEEGEERDDHQIVVLGIRNSNAKELKERELTTKQQVKREKSSFFSKLKSGKEDKNVDSSSSVATEHTHRIQLYDYESLRNSYSEDRLEALMALLTNLASSSNQHKSLLLHGKDTRGRTALHYAAELGRDNMCSLLLQYDDKKGPSLLNIADHDGHTPNDLAIRQGHECLALLETSSHRGMRERNRASSLDNNERLNFGETIEMITEKWRKKDIESQPSPQDTSHIASNISSQ